jgi:cell division septal protein FtsQ
MKKIYKLIILLTSLLFLTTYTTKEISIFSTQKKSIFQIKKIKITNNYLINKQEILKKVKKINNKNIFLIKKEEVEQPLSNINYIDKIEVKKKYPDTIIIKIYETKPIAIITIKNKKFIIDNKSNLISFNDNKLTKSLPNVFGEGADKEFVVFLGKLKKYNFLIKSIKNFYYFKIGRWDLELTNNKIIKLPSNKLEMAIKESIKLLNREDFKNYSIIDLRINDKIIVE